MPINIIGDKGYIINENDKIKLLKKKVVIITPKRKNQKIKTTTEEKVKLKKRYKVENLFSKIKAYNRIHVIKDRLMSTYMGFVYMDLICITSHKNESSKKSTIEGKREKKNKGKSCWIS